MLIPNNVTLYRRKKVVSIIKSTQNKNFIIIKTLHSIFIEIRKEFKDRSKSIKSAAYFDHKFGRIETPKDSKAFFKLELMEKMKNILFCSISHELRSPVNHINGILELINKNCPKDEKILKFVKIGLSSIEMLTHKIDDILDYALIETNTLNLK